VISPVFVWLTVAIKVFTAGRSNPTRQFESCPDLDISKNARDWACRKCHRRARREEGYVH
tara:strand:+ start:2046 stop:2225 length:180 start_codon:yes stop_codon:yes gene_type:complete